jgi:uncharacterized protein
MKVDISSILKYEGASTQFSVAVPSEQIMSSTSQIQFINDIDIYGEINHISGIIKVTGHIDTEYVTKCDRCLKEFEKKIQIQIQENFISSDKLTDQFAYLYQGFILDLEQLTRDAVVLEIPSKQLCNEECKGLCPDCGMNWNLSSCQCNQSTIDGKFDKLKVLFQK